MSKDKRFLKDEAQRALSHGELSKALDHLQKHCAEDPKDLRSRRKVAELLERLGREKEAIREYRQLAENYAEEGFLLQAISVNKIILRIDPSLKDVNGRLAQLYTEKYQQTKPGRPFPLIPLFSELNEQELQSLVSQVRAKTFQKDERICQEGTRAIPSWLSIGERWGSLDESQKRRNDGSAVLERETFLGSSAFLPIKRGTPR